MTARVWAALAAVMVAAGLLIAAAAVATYMQTARPVPVAAHSHVWANRAAPAAVSHVPWGAGGSARVSTAAQTVPAVVLISPPMSPPPPLAANRGTQTTLTARRRPLCQDTEDSHGLVQRGCVWGPWNRGPGQWVPPEKRNRCAQDPTCSPPVVTEPDYGSPYLDL